MHFIHYLNVVFHGFRFAAYDDLRGSVVPVVPVAQVAAVAGTRLLKLQPQKHKASVTVVVNIHV